MSLSTCSNSKPRVSTRSSVSAQNMKASSGSGLCPSLISIARRLAAGRRRASEEPTLERSEQLLARERPDVLRAAVVLGHAKVVLEAPVGLLERILELVALEEVVVAARLVGGAVLWVHGTAHRPDRALAALDPDHDALLRALIVEATDRALGESA